MFVFVLNFAGINFIKDLLRVYLFQYFPTQESSNQLISRYTFK